MAAKEKILVVDDEPSIRKYLQTLLEVDGFEVETVNSGKEALDKVNKGERPDFVILDVLMPEKNGIETLKELMQIDRSLNVIMLSCSNEVTTVVEAIRLGALDYLTKPFHLPELSARVAAILRRKSFDGKNRIVLGELTLDLHDKIVKTAAGVIDLTRKEYELLVYFMGNKNRVVTKEAIVEHLWGGDIDMSDNYDFIYTHMKNLRRKLVEAGAQDIDVVITRAHVFGGRWQELYDEIAAFKQASGPAHMKVILGTGDLLTLRNVARASFVAMMAGADFIKTSTGKEPTNATLPVGFVMTRAIREYAQETGMAVGFKPAGGIRTAKQSIEWLALMKEELGVSWMKAELFRFGASGLLNDIERQLEHHATGRYSADYRHPIA